MRLLFLAMALEVAGLAVSITGGRTHNQLVAWIGIVLAVAGWIAALAAVRRNKRQR